jgi:PAS domain S-box-containing protein
MKAPGLPQNETQRLADLYEYGILDTPAERVFDEVAALAATICGTEFAAITLIDSDRQWFKAQHGLHFSQTSRDESICGHAILEQDVFIVPDTAADSRFADNPLLRGSPEVRFYAGTRLNSSRGHAIGMLCVMDRRPHELDEHQRKALTQLADVLMAAIEAGRKMRLASWLGTLVDKLRDEILVLDPATLQYLHANQAALAATGLTLQEICRLTPMQVRGGERSMFEALVARLREGEPFVEFRTTYARAGGSQYPAVVRWELLMTRGRPVVLSIVQDVSGRAKVERMKDEFVSVVNHELRTPLTSIHGAVKLLQQGAAGELPAQACHLVELAAQNTERLRSIVDDILDLERIAAGRMEFDLQPVRAREALERAAQSGEPLAQVAGLSIRVAGDPGWWVRADSRRLQQVLANLVSNAVKFSPGASAVRLSLEAMEDRVRFGVTDHGPGVPPQFRDRIFQRFAQAEMDTNRSKGGSGLGLAIAKEMVEQMHGRIGYDSRGGQTTFWIDLPRARQP